MSERSRREITGVQGALDARLDGGHRQKYLGHQIGHFPGLIGQIEAALLFFSHEARYIII